MDSTAGPTERPPHHPGRGALRALWAASGLSNLGDGLHQFALPLLAAQLTTAPSLVAGVTVMATLAWPLFGLQAGSIVDRTDRRRLLLVANLARAAALSGLVLAALAGRASIAWLYAAALVLGAGETLVDTALTSAVPGVVGRGRLGWANARITAAQTLTNSFVAPPLAGFLVGLGRAAPLGAGVLAYAGAAAALAGMQGHFAAAPPGHAGDAARRGRHLTGGLRFLWGHRLLRRLTLLTAAMNVFWAAWTALIVLHAVAPGPMGLSTFGYSLLLTALAAGSVTGSAACEGVRCRLGTRNALALDFVGTAALLGVPALTTSPLLVGAAAAAAGFGASVWVVLVSSLRQSLVPDGLLGRVYSASRLVSFGAMPLGAAAAGLAAELLGVRAVFLLGGIANLLLLFAFLRVVRPAGLVGTDGTRRP